MTEFTIILVAIWAYPILGFLLFQFTKPNEVIRNRIIGTITVISFTAIIGYLVNVSTTSTELDWLFFTIPYLLISILLWRAFYHNTKAIKSLAVFGMALIFGLGYFSGSLGILGIGLGIGDYQTDAETWYDTGFIYKETSLGNALADYRGKRVEISKTIPWLPIIEWEVKTKEYFGRAVYKNRLEVEFDSDKKEFYLSTIDQFKDSTKFWADTLKIEH
ncbi:MAG: hypothetical protein JJ895_09310 [Balneolaceae bacterium]|nr:hypothetical protein [Balneolaceae bacterium]